MRYLLQEMRHVNIVLSKGFHILKYSFNNNHHDLKWRLVYFVFFRFGSNRHGNVCRSWPIFVLTSLKWVRWSEWTEVI